ncbi:MAG: DUF2911 domain-containing protein [Acidobacteriota bacterium]
MKIRTATPSRALAAALLVAAAAAPALAQQLDLPRPSPKATVSQVVGLTDVTIAYCRPGVKGRTIWGDLVPYGQVWRTGANEATTITFSTDVTVAGNPVPAGTYGLFTIPGKDEWTVILNKGAKQWGAYEYTQAEDFVRFTVKPQAAPFAERMTFSFPNTTMDATDVALAWEKVQITFPIKVDVNTKVIADARAALGAVKPDDWRTPLRAAVYCLDNDVNLQEARGWMEKSLAAKETMYGLMAKARFAALDGKTTEAIAVIKKAIEVGKSATPPNDIAPAERLLAEWSK